MGSNVRGVRVAQCSGVSLSGVVISRSCAKSSRHSHDMIITVQVRTKTVHNIYTELVWYAVWVCEINIIGLLTSAPSSCTVPILPHKLWDNTHDT